MAKNLTVTATVYCYSLASYSSFKKKHSRTFSHNMYGLKAKANAKTINKTKLHSCSVDIAKTHSYTKKTKTILNHACLQQGIEKQITTTSNESNK